MSDHCCVNGVSLPWSNWHLYLQKLLEADNEYGEWRSYLWLLGLLFSWVIWLIPSHPLRFSLLLKYFHLRPSLVVTHSLPIAGNSDWHKSIKPWCPQLREGQILSAICTPEFGIWLQRLQWRPCSCSVPALAPSCFPHFPSLKISSLVNHRHPIPNLFSISRKPNLRQGEIRKMDVEVVYRQRQCKAVKGRTVFCSAIQNWPTQNGLIPEQVSCLQDDQWDVGRILLNHSSFDFVWTCL